MEPYRGLQPYTEENEDIFFGREAEKAILIDKLLSEKLSLLFAATGVGKSSLLQAAVMPELKRPAHENLDVVYYNDWVTDPLHGLPQKILAVLRERGKIAADFLVTHPLAPSLWKREGENEASFLPLTLSSNVSSLWKREGENETAPLFPSLSSPEEKNEPDSSSPLSFPKRGGQGVSFRDFLHLCATFASEPLVIILDQFEEFFQYHRYSPAFQPFIEQFAEVVRDRTTSVAFLISMREDFALNLNAFKGHLQTTLFENYYRLEKLDVQAAAEAIRNPAAKVAFRYETGLVEEMLKDLADQEREGRVGGQAALLADDAPKFVEAPNVQIVCQQLWELEKGNSSKIIRLETYNAKGRSRGFINSYFASVIAAFSPSEKKLASKAFDHLVTPRGTKMAYPVKDLSAKLRVKEDDLRQVLVKLEKARVLRSQPRKNEIWYELYHDIFSGIIYQWNTVYKAKQRTKRALIATETVVAVLFFLFAVYEVVTNLTNYHLRLSAKGISDQLELYRGKADSWDLARLQRYEAETPYSRSQIEPDKQFVRKPVAEYDQLNVELIGQLPLVARISKYWEMGAIDNALKLADKSISKDDVIRTQTVIDLLTSFRSQKSLEILNNHLGSLENVYTRTSIISALGTTQSEKVTDCLIPLLTDQNSDVRSSAAKVLAKLGKIEAISPLMELLKASDSDVRSSAASALGQLGSDEVVTPLVELLEDQDSDVGSSAAMALGQLHSDKAVMPLLERLKDQEPEVRSSATRALGQLGDNAALEPLIELLTDSNVGVQSSAVKALGRLGSDRVVGPLVALLKKQDFQMRMIVSSALYQLSSDNEVLSLLRNNDVVDLLVKSLKEQGGIYFLKDKTTKLLVRLGGSKAIGLLSELLKEQASHERDRTVETLSQFNNSDVVGQLLKLLTDQRPDVRSSAARALGQIGGDAALESLLELLKDQDVDVRDSAATALGQIGNDKATNPLIALLKDQKRSVRNSAAIALGELSNSEVVRPLLNLLGDQDRFMQRSVAEALGQIGVEESLSPLMNLLKDQELSVKSSAVRALGQLGSGEAIELLLKLLKEQNLYQSQYGGWVDERANVAIVLGQLGSSEAVEPLLELLKDQGLSQNTWYWSGDNVWESVTIALSELSSSKALSPLLKLLRVDVQNPGSDDVRCEIATTIGKLGSSEAVEALLAFLKDRSRYPYESYEDRDVRGYVAEALGQLGDRKAVKLLVELLKDPDDNVQRGVALALGKLSAREAMDSLKILYTKESGPKVAVAAVLLGLDQKDGLEFLREKSKNQSFDERKKVAAELGEAPSEQGNIILLDMLSDENIHVKIQVITSLGQAQTISSLPRLHKLLEDSNSKIRKAVVDALGEIASSDSIDLLKQTALNTEERVPTRIAAINGLGKIGTEQAATTLLEILDKVNKHYHYKTIMALGKTRSKQALPKLLELLREQERRKVDWRKVRDENTDSYDDKQMEEWRKRLAAVEPQTYMEFELAHSIAMIDPDGEGVKLLSHDLAKIREGAWMGLARLPLTVTRPFYVTNGPAAVNLIARLDKERKASGNPFFEHAAYRAIDEMLIALEAYGRKPELDALQTFLPKVQDAEGVKTRVEWTIDRLKERKEE